MQVSDSSPGAAPGPAAKDEVRPTGDAAGGRGARASGRRFRSALERKRETRGRAATCGLGGGDGGMVPRRISGGAGGQDDGGRGPSGASAARAVDRILVGSGPDGAQARIHIGAGALAGTEIQLSTGAAGHVVEARLLTHAATSRQTLSLVMDEIRLRLRDRGIVLSTTATGARSSRAARRREAAGEGAAGRGGTGEVRPVNAQGVRPGDLSARRRSAGARHARGAAGVRDVAGAVVVGLPPLGTATVTFNGFDTEDGQRIGGVELAVSFGAARGRVCIEAAFAAVSSMRSARGGRVLGGAGDGACRARCAGRRARAAVRSRRRERAPRSAAAARPDAVAPILFRLETVVASGWLRLSRRSGAGRCAPTMARPGACGRAAFPSRVMSRSR